MSRRPACTQCVQFEEYISSAEERGNVESEEAWRDAYMYHRVIGHAVSRAAAKAQTGGDWTGAA